MCETVFVFITEEETDPASQLSFYVKSYNLLSSMTPVYTPHSTVCFLKIIQEIACNYSSFCLEYTEPTFLPNVYPFSRSKWNLHGSLMPFPMPYSSSPQAEFTMFFPQPLLASWLPSTYSCVLELIDFLDCFPLRLNSLRTVANIIFIIIFPNGSTNESLNKCFIVYWMNTKWSMNPSWFIIP